MAEMEENRYKEVLDQLYSMSPFCAESEVSLVDQNVICYAAKPNSILVRADGRLGKCTVALDDQRNDLGRMLPDGTIKFDNHKLRKYWIYGFRSNNKSALMCPVSAGGDDGN